MKQQFIKASFAILLILLIITGCQKKNKDIDSIQGLEPTATITATVVGRIVNDQNEPVDGATIKSGSNTALTNINGEFTIFNASLKNNAAFITAEKSGYFKGSRTFFAKQSKKHYIEIMLLPKQILGSINSVLGGSININNGSSLNLPANAVVTASNNNPYAGNINVAIAWINPSSTDLYRQMPGDLRGIDSAGTENFLQSFGMLGVELTGNNGEKLQIANGKKASLIFPLPASVRTNAPATIALWSFNDSTGLWKQEGFANKTGNFYSAEVSHFSFWNVDIGFPLARFSATIVDQQEQPLKHVAIRIVRTNGSIGMGYTDETGFITGAVPANEPLALEVLPSYSCNSSIITKNVGPFTINKTNPLGTIAITLIQPIIRTITGNAVGCNNTPITNGFINVKCGLSIYNAPISNTGNFSLSISSCSPSPQIAYHAVDIGNNQQSNIATKTLSSSINNVGTISACGISLGEYVNFTFDSIPYSIRSATDSISVVLYTNNTGGNLGFTIRALSTTGESIYFSVSTNGTIGPASLGSQMFITLPFTGYSYGQSGITSANITEFSNVTGGYIGGNFTALFRNVNTNETNLLMQGTFRFKRP